MKSLFTAKRIVITILIIIIAAAIFYLRAQSNKETPLITTTVETGDVRQLVSVSGIVETEQLAELAFPVSGIVRSVAVSAGTIVKAGDTIASLDTRSLLADRSEAQASLSQTIASRDELLAGPTVSARDITAETLASAESSLATTRISEDRKIKNSYQALLSNDLEARTDDINERAVAPSITGSYTCNNEGSYTIEMFSSKADSGYSYRLSGLENGTYEATNDQPAPFGSCGLFIRFDASSSYDRSAWEVNIPNKESSSYTTFRNAYELAKTQADGSIALAEQNLMVASATAENQNAPARNEAVIRANASITQARARLERIDAAISDRTILAPFDGTITDVNILSGETAGALPVVTLLADKAFDVTARIPEIDISKIIAGQEAEMYFDANLMEVVLGEVSFISPQATLIDGVSYYETKIVFDEMPSWIRNGLNADVEIIIKESQDAYRVPKRFVINTDNGAVVLKKQNDIVSTTSVKVVLEGNDGYTALLSTEIEVGDEVVAP